MNVKNKGMLLESIINSTNLFYFNQKVAMIHKKNLDVQFKGVDIKNHKLVLKEATIKSKSTVDYYGIYKGKFLAFEAKSTEDKNLSLANIKNHQIEYLSLVESFGGIAFWIFYFKIQNKFILIKHSDLKNIIKNKKTLSFDLCKEQGIILELSFPGVLDFINYI
ncbi:Holliday junction resolvase RecU [Metamycoplasma neophronis]|uniref:Holliday junction resolvase RecU n=1 Tax=Metamycoplasma neophronis TaxID=872983 RepID=A0ABY2Z127_9BACT|nr:Holliday junction resolvase RecU [Metamycoplasma neophronis]TPR54112.1 Holliday junction resolvase RecU [Metamycoplasma neophronis]